MIFFTRRDDGPSIEEFIQSHKSLWKEKWKSFVDWGFKDDAQIWWQPFEFLEWMSLYEEALENILLDKWYHTKCKDKYITKCLFSCGKSILHVHGCIHKENVIVSINPSFQHFFINIQLVNRLQFDAKNIHKTHRLRVKMFKFLKI
jgi:hypothetical protein